MNHDATASASRASGKVSLKLLSAGAAQGLVKALEQPFSAATGARIDGTFGAVGAMKDALLGGAACDVMILTQSLIDALVASGELLGSPDAALGRVRTGLAIREGDAAPAIGTPEDLRVALLAAERVFSPDAVRSTAGIHFANVLRQLGIADALASRLATFPNGATAMRELARATERHAIGCTQITEIKATPGVRLVGALPAEFELATVYTAAVARNATEPELAGRFIEWLNGSASREAALAAGFELDAR